MSEFRSRHIGPDAAEIQKMVQEIGVDSLSTLIDQTVPSSIRLKRPLALPAAQSEAELLSSLHEQMSRNEPFRSFLGMGYHDCLTPAVIQRNILENPGWYTAYTPYQAEISQGRLEALLNFQTMVLDLTQLEIANASLLDEATAAAEAMHLLHAGAPDDRRVFVVSGGCHPQTRDVVRTRAAPLGIEVVLADGDAIEWSRKPFGLLLQYPATDGAVVDHRALIERAHAEGAGVAMAADLLALTLLEPPGALGADVAVGSTQRFGVPLGFGGPHAAYIAAKGALTRSMPGRIIGLSKDAQGKPALRMALQTREQHIRREKATSNICTAQVLLAVMAGMYAVYHGPKGLKAIAERVNGMAKSLAASLQSLGFSVAHAQFFDTVRIQGSRTQIAEALKAARTRRFNLRVFDDMSVGIALDEATTPADIEALAGCFAGGKRAAVAGAPAAPSWPGSLARKGAYLTHAVFNAHHSETEMLRYMRLLESKDFSLVHGMIPLGSCTMKLNATAEMIPVTWPEVGRIHPFAPVEQVPGYQKLFADLEGALREITGLPSVSLQPNAGSQGEYAGLLAIRGYHASRGQGHRDVCLIPSSAHGTNPASAAMVGCRVVVVACDEQGNVELADLEAKAREHRERLAALMATYPSTHGVFEEDIQRICRSVHDNGGQVYMDGANMNALVGLTRPGDIGADVCHINLHKTFCIPHGGGGPGMGPIAVAAHLASFLPGHPSWGERSQGAVSAAPWGSASILPISWAYIAMMGPGGLKDATEIAILNANYIAHRLQPYFPVLYRGKRGRVAHECILDLRPLKKTSGIEVEDVAKRLMDYGFHAPTLAFPVAGTLMVEPTESESKTELDRFCDAMISIRQEIRDVEEGRQPKENNVLKNAPHTAEVLLSDGWDRPYSRERAAYPVPSLRHAKFWPSVGRLNAAFGDRNLVCSCPPLSEYA
jgi:glycine dehydrogenase